MKKLFFLFLIVGLVAASCKKPVDIPASQDVVFKATPAATGNFKESEPEDCVNPMAHYALITIDEVIHPVDVFYLNGVIYTNTLKLTPGVHVISNFVLMNDNGTPNDTSDDVIVQATPLIGSEYENFVEMPLPFEFEVDAFFKLEVNIEILCFVPNQYQLFGFVWFTVEEVFVREVCFYGDFCTKYFLDYGQSLYARQLNGLRHDMPAIFKIEVWRTHDVNTNGVPNVTTETLTEWIKTYDNEEWLGEGAPLCVKYPDFKDVEDLIEFKLFILVKVGDGFEYVLFHTFSTWDAMPLENIGDDNVLDFVLGSCVVDADLILAPYMNLPPNTDIHTATTWNPGTLGTFFDITLSGIGSGYEIQNGLFGGWVGGNTDEFFIFDYSYTADVYSSLYPSVLPAKYAATAGVLDNINWLGNNLYRYPGYTSWDFQYAVWGMIHPPDSSGDPMVIQMISDATAYGNDYLPPVGGYAAVIFVDPNPAPDWGGIFMYMIFMLVDP